MFTYKINNSFFLVLLLIYPLLYIIPGIHNIGYEFAVYYFIFVTISFILISYYLVISRNYILKFYSIDIKLLLILFGVLFVVAFNTIKSIFLNPIIFYLYILLIYISFSQLKLTFNYRVILFFYFAYLIISVCLLFFQRGYHPLNNRFIGFANTSTVYSVYMEVIAIVTLSFAPNRTKKILIYFSVLMFILISETRLNIAFYLALPILSFLYYKIKKRFFLFLLFIVIINLFYPIYGYLYSASYITVENRYEDGRDASFALRNVLFNKMLSEVGTMELKEILFGKGAEYTRNLTEQTYGLEPQPHQDFVRFFIDFGIIAFIMYMLFLYILMFKNITTYLLTSLYLFSFYHNMLYARELIGLIILFFFARVTMHDLKNRITLTFNLNKYVS